MGFFSEMDIEVREMIRGGASRSQVEASFPMLRADEVDAYFNGDFDDDDNYLDDVMDGDDNYLDDVMDGVFDDNYDEDYGADFNDGEFI